MKKFLALLLFLLFVTTPILATNAEEVNSDSATFIESMENLQNLKSYRLNQNIVGDFEAGDESFGYKGSYHIKMLTDIINKGAYEMNSKTLIGGYLDVAGTGPEREFDLINVNFRARIKMLAEDGVYVRLESLNLKAEGVPADEMESYLEFQQELENKLKIIRGFWFHIPIEEIKDEYSHELPSAFEEEEFKANLKEKGLEETIKETLNELMTATAIDGPSVTQIEKVVNNFFNTEFFTKRIVVAGPQKGFTNYTVNKRRIVQFVQSAASTLGENISAMEIDQLRTLLDKFYLSIMTNVNPEYKIHDFFRFKLVLRNLDAIGLKFVSFYYSYKVSKINDVDPVVEPDVFSSYETLESLFY